MLDHHCDPYIPSTTVLGDNEHWTRLSRIEKYSSTTPILDECLALLASGSDPNVPSLEALNEA